MIKWRKKVKELTARVLGKNNMKIEIKKCTYEEQNIKNKMVMCPVCKLNYPCRTPQGSCAHCSMSLKDRRIIFHRYLLEKNMDAGEIRKWLYEFDKKTRWGEYFKSIEAEKKMNKCHRCGKPSDNHDYLCVECIPTVDKHNKQDDLVDKMIAEHGKYNLEQEQLSEPELIPFDLEKALAGDEVTFRCPQGRKIKEILHSKKMNRVIVVTNTDSVWSTYHYEDGRYMRDSPSTDDLFMAPKPKVIKWANVYKSHGGNVVMGEFTFNYKKEATEYAANNQRTREYLKTISFEV